MEAGEAAVTQDAASKTTKTRLASLWRGTADICGVMTVIIAVSWQFPSELWNAYFSTQAKLDEEIRQSINEMALVYRDYASSQTMVVNDHTRLMLNTINIVRLSYEIDKLSRLPDAAFANASYFENYTIGAMAFQVGKYEAAGRFYHAANVSAGREKIDPQEVFVGQASVAVAGKGVAGIAEARDYLKKGLKSAFARQKKAPAEYSGAPLSVLMEIATAEWKFGSWDCGNTIGSIVEAQISSLHFANNPNIQNLLSVFRANKPLNKPELTQTAVSSGFQCDYIQAALLDNPS